MLRATNRPPAHHWAGTISLCVEFYLRLRGNIATESKQAADAGTDDTQRVPPRRG